MSYTTILAIYPGERFEDIQELRNSWQSAPLVWDAIWNRYGEKRHEYDSAMTAGDRLWPLHKDKRLKDFERAVFMMTFDRAYTLKKDYGRASADLAAFMATHNVGGHWVAIRDLLMTDPDYPAIGLYCTSVADNPFQGPWNEEAEDYGPLDWGQAYSIYDEMEEMSKAIRDGEKN